MNSVGSSWFSLDFRTWRPTKEKKVNVKALRQKIHEISRSSVLDEAGIEDAQILTLTREDLNELFPGIRNFQLRRAVMALITETVKDSVQHSPDALAGAMKRLMHKNRNNDDVQGVLEESLLAFRQMEDQLKAAQASLKPYIEVLSSLTEASDRKEELDIVGNSKKRLTSTGVQINTFETWVRVHSFVCGQTLGTDRQIITHLKRVIETDLSDCQLILAFNPVTSRAGTDTEAALKKIPANKPAVLVTMHHTFKHNFTCPSFNISSSQSNIVEHVNVLFHDSEHGLLNCQANENAMSKLQSVLNCYM